MDTNQSRSGRPLAASGDKASPARAADNPRWPPPLPCDSFHHTWWLSNFKDAADDGEQAVRGDDQRDTGNDGGCGGEADGGGVRAALHPAQATGQRDDAAENET